MKDEMIDKESLLLDYLLIKFNKLSRNSVKNLLVKKQIVVNGKVVTRYDYGLKKGDIISYNGKKDTMRLKIIYEDDMFLVIDKPNNLLTVATDKEKEKTAYVDVCKYIKQNDPKGKIFVLHRLDKDTSGVLAFCKDEKVKNDLQDNWNECVIKREYVAIVEGILNKKNGSIKSYLKEGKNRMVYSTNQREGKLAITEYKVIKENSKCSLVNVNLLTGRKNQIRVHFKDLGHPLVGDKKYGSIDDPLRRLCLHASKLVIKYAGREHSFIAQTPSSFNNLMK